MVYPQIYLGQTPPTAAGRRTLRERALNLHAALRAGSRPELRPSYMLLNFGVGSAPTLVELLLLCPNAVIVGAIRDYPGPIEVTPDGRWIDMATGAPIREERGQVPLQAVRERRDAVRGQLLQDASGLVEPAAQPFDRVVGALICAPTTHPDSRISLDVADHRQQLKILGLDELAGLVSMLRSGAQLTEEAMRRIVGELFAGQLWHDGEKLLFELAPGRFQLRLFAEDGQPGAALPLIEGENVVGRRKAARRFERRVTLSGDDLISSDHAQIICDDRRVALRDTSKNGTWVALPDGTEERLRAEARTLAPGTMLRMGVTRMRLERVEDAGAGMAT